MRQSLHIGNEPNFQKIIIASAILHVLFITLATIPLRTRDTDYKSYSINIVTPSEFRRATRGPAAAGKVKKGKSIIKMKTPPRRKVRKVPKADISLEAEKKIAAEIEKLREAEKLRVIEKLRALNAISKLKKKKEKQTAEGLEALRKTIRGSVAIQTGTGGSDINAYAALVREKIWSEWIYPDLDTRDLEVIISFVINEEGKVIAPRVIKTSGNTLYDRSAMKAIQKASPLPPPAVEEDFEVRFRL